MSSGLLNQGRALSKPKDSGKSTGVVPISGDVSTSRYSARPEDDYVYRQERQRAELATQIGIDYENEKNKYAWFIEQVMNLELPPEWIREEDPDGRAVYFNESESITATRHPLVNKFRAIFSEILQSEEVGRHSAENFLKAYKEKMQVLGIERKDDKKKSKKGPQQAIVLGSTLSHQVLKGHARDDKASRQGTSDMLALMEEGKSKERYEKLKEMLNRGRTLQSQANELNEIQLTEKVLYEFRDMYRELYGKDLKQMPPALESTKEYLHCDPNEVADAAKLFGVVRSEGYLFWILRAYASMPLPELWTKAYDTEQKAHIFVDLRNGTKLTVHPCFLWIKENISFNRELAKHNPEMQFSAIPRMTFLDSLERDFEVDIGLLLNEGADTTAMNNINKSTLASKPQISNNDYRKMQKKETNPNFRDAHLLELASQLKIDVNLEVHLMMVIEEFVRDKDKDERWFFRQTPDGQSFWVNHEHKKAVKEYPHIEELRKRVEEARKRIKDDKITKYKKDGTLIKTLFRKYTEETALRILMQEAKHFVEYFIANKDILQEDPAMAERKGYNLSKLTKLIGGEISKADLLDILFYCPFDFSVGLGELSFGGDANLLRKFRLMVRNGPKTNDHIEGDGDSDASDITTESAKERRAKIRNPRKLITAADGFNAEGIFKKNEKREFLKMMFDFEQKYGDTDLADELDYNKTTAEAQKKALEKKEKEKQDATQAAGKKVNVQSQNSKGVKGKQANAPSNPSLVINDSKLANLEQKTGSLGNQNGSSSELGGGEITDRKSDQTGLSTTQQEPARMTTGVDSKKGGSQALKNNSGAAVTTKKDQMLDKLGEGHGISLEKWEIPDMPSRGAANKGESSLNQKPDAQGFVRQTLSDKLGVKWVKDGDENNRQPINLADLQALESEEISDDEEESDAQTSGDEARDEEAAKNGLEIHDAVKDNEAAGKKRHRSKGKKRGKKKKHLANNPENLKEDESNELGIVGMRLATKKKPSAKLRAYKEVEEIGPNGQKIKKRVPVEIKHSKDGRKAATNMRADSADSTSEIDGTSIAEYLRKVRTQNQADSGRKKAKVSIQKLWAENSERERAENQRKRAALEGLNVNMYKASVYDVLARLNLRELDSNLWDFVSLKKFIRAN